MNITKTGKRIREIRESKQIRQKNLAEQLEISDKYLSAVERGVSKPSLDLIVEIANVLGVGADDILRDSLNIYENCNKAQLPKRVKTLSPECQDRIQLLADFLIENDFI